MRGSAIPPHHHSSILNSMNPSSSYPRPRRGPVILCADVCVCARYVCVHGKAFYVAYLLSINEGQSGASDTGRSCREMETKGKLLSWEDDGFPTRPAEL